MSMVDFATALGLVLQMEGGLSTNKHDPGGRTHKGVTQKRYDAWRTAMRQRKRDVALITEAGLVALYRNGYAEPIRYDQLPAGIGYPVLDDAVSSGPVEAIRELQAALGLKVDGIVGVLTLNACAGVTDRAALIKKLCNNRLGFIWRLKTWSFFKKGWTARVSFVRTHALAMV